MICFKIYLNSSLVFGNKIVPLNIEFVYKSLKITLILMAILTLAFLFGNHTKFDRHFCFWLSVFYSVFSSPCSSGYDLHSRSKGENCHSCLVSDFKGKEVSYRFFNWESEKLSSITCLPTYLYYYEWILKPIKCFFYTFVKYWSLQIFTLLDAICYYITFSVNISVKF